MGKTGKSVVPLHIQMPEIPQGAKVVGHLPAGSAVFELPPFAQYIVFHVEHPPKIITYDGKMVLLDAEATMVLK